MRLLNRIADFAPGNLASLATYGDLRGWPIPLARRTSSLISRSRQIHWQITIWCALLFRRCMVLNLVSFSLAIQTSMADPKYEYAGCSQIACIFPVQALGIGTHCPSPTLALSIG